MGFHGTDMDLVAGEAGLAKGLLYYYYKSKRQLFVALFEWVAAETAASYDGFLSASPDAPAIDQLAAFAWSVFGSALADPRQIQFAMRMPFDARAVFEGDAWDAGMKHSALFMERLARVIARGMDEGDIPRCDPALAANAFWAVFVANLFHFSGMIHGGDAPQSPAARYEDVVRFCFQGLGIPESRWQRAVRACASEKGGVRP